MSAIMDRFFKKAMAAIRRDHQIFRVNGDDFGYELQVWDMPYESPRAVSSQRAHRMLEAGKTRLGDDFVLHVVFGCEGRNDQRRQKEFQAVQKTIQMFSSHIRFIDFPETQDFMTNDEIRTILSLTTNSVHLTFFHFHAQMLQGLQDDTRLEEISIYDDVLDPMDHEEVDSLVQEVTRFSALKYLNFRVSLSDTNAFNICGSLSKLQSNSLQSLCLSIRDRNLTENGLAAFRQFLVERDSSIGMVLDLTNFKCLWNSSCAMQLAKTLIMSPPVSLEWLRFKNDEKFSVEPIIILAKGMSGPGSHLSLEAPAKSLMRLLNNSPFLEALAQTEIESLSIEDYGPEGSRLPDAEIDKMVKAIDQNMNTQSFWHSRMSGEQKRQINAICERNLMILDIQEFIHENQERQKANPTNATGVGLFPALLNKALDCGATPAYIIVQHMIRLPSEITGLYSPLRSPSI